MKVRGFSSLKFNTISWQVFLIAEKVILLECAVATPIEKIHESTRLIRDILKNQLEDIVPAYHSIAIFSQFPLDKLMELLKNRKTEISSVFDKKEIIKLPICYELGQDLDKISHLTDLKKEKIIAIHLEATYRVIFIGFTPGFIYSDGLDATLVCARLKNPRKYIPAGTVGIGGSQTGIYSLTGPGGWNSIGRTPIKLFDKEKQPPMKLTPGTNYCFYRITKEAFESWGK